MQAALRLVCICRATFESCACNLARHPASCLRCRRRTGSFHGKRCLRCVDRGGCGDLRGSRRLAQVRLSAQARSSAQTPASILVSPCSTAARWKRCIVHSGAVIGQRRFWLCAVRCRWIKIPQIGAVVIGDDVEIGANTPSIAVRWVTRSSRMASSWITRFRLRTIALSVLTQSLPHVSALRAVRKSANAAELAERR